jgi:hypothetical protein
MRGEAAVARVTGEERMVTKVLGVGSAIGTNAACVAEPWNADAAAKLGRIDSVSERIDNPDYLMARNQRQFRLL